MSFKDLEKRLAGWPEIQKTLDTVSREAFPEYARILAYVLSIASDLDENQVKDYAVIGGYATLFHIVKALGNEALPRWRGSGDLDISAQSGTAESVIIGQYDTERHQSHLHPQKVQLKIKDSTLPENCEIDLYLTYRKQPISLPPYTITEQFWNAVETIDIFDIQIPVASKKDLLSMKLAVNNPPENMPRPRDIGDIFTLIGLMEKEKSPTQLWDELPWYGKIMMQKILQHPEYREYETIKELGVLVSPSKNYLEGLKTRVKLLPKF